MVERKGLFEGSPPHMRVIFGTGADLNLVESVEMLRRKESSGPANYITLSQCLINKQKNIV